MTTDPALTAQIANFERAVLRRDAKLARGVLHADYALVDSITDEELAELVPGVSAAAAAIIRGDMRSYVDLVNHADDYTLMPPSDGEPRRGFDDAPEALEAMSRYFRGGEAELEVFASYTSGNLAVLVAIERQHGEVGDLPDQDLSLRVTLVFRQEPGRWRLVHRHADPLVHELAQDRLSALLRGDL